jgi:heme exporter protein B
VSATRLFLSLLKWDLLRELRRKEAVLNMSLFAVLMLFLVALGTEAIFRNFANHPVAQLRELGTTLRPVFFWVIVLFAGTVGLSQSFAAERQGSALTGLILAPIDLGVFYLAKVAATWLYVMAMELLLLVAYVLLFNLKDWAACGPLVLVMGIFTLGYVASGVLLAAMTSALRAGGEVVLRILLYPLLIPLVSLTLRVREGTFGADLATAGEAEPLAFGHYAALALAFDAVYLTAGFLLFPRVFEE